MNLVCFHLCAVALLYIQSVQGDALPLFIDSHENNAPTPELARLNGYRSEIHNVTTEDGYILQIHRIPGGRVTPKNCSLPPVLLVHSFLDTSACWLIAGPDKALGYKLADQGYDVWLGNVRGNTYARFNIYYNVNEDDFWDFSWDDAGLYDLPATIDYILNTTGNENILYIGHSQGTTEFFVLCSLRPEYNDKVQYMVALAPTAYLTNTRSFFKLMAPFVDELALVQNVPGHGEILSRNSDIANIFHFTCSLRINKVICESLVFLGFGIDPVEFNGDLLPIISGHNPGGTSFKSIIHFTQLARSGRFQRYDYGAVKNLETYNSISPPDFNLSQITVPLSVFYGDNDYINDVQDVMHLVNQLKVKVDVYRVNLTTFNYVDFVFARNVDLLVNNQVLSVLAAKQTLTNRTSCDP